ncbi:type 4b pilus protein PilO2 [Bordetella holmesii]|uniref:Pilin accessory family protein n=2 Tax=Bordetella holmesii TaxID=35814 RepID=A0ABN0S0Y2_9BORD|nr:type 4b pilus protein PilO2 [Bordetella holmesii]AHV91658.1 pilin accessory family protein [Bordetella holmesii ATCC 51541]AIT25386.1 pilin accessory family protein [Bordetella holmesii 44057]EWM45949.1 pilin accessory family protein [Bordetella holmesii 70147]EWM48856.1 pilin accessory family protein [Bordetella holmesii 41130]EWM50082.1 pilin accessory family protein [Bordetella holmesii 35009]
MADLCLRQVGAHGQWVHGLSWFAVVGSHARALARLRARQMRASHYLLGGDRAMTAGCARVPGRGPRYSAAQQVASRYGSETFAAIVTLDQGHWLVAVQDGAVLVGGDQMFSDKTQALAALEAFDLPEIASPDAISLALQIAPLPAARLRALPPRPSRWLGGLLVALGCAVAWSAFMGEPVKPARQVASVSAERPFRPALCLGPVLGSLYRLPMRTAGWRLSGAQCSPQQQWQCQARYQPESAQALSVDFQNRVSDQWQVDFPGLDEAVLHWTAGSVCRADPQPLERRWMQALQPWRGAFSEMRIGPWADTPDGRLRLLRLAGPLRSYSLPVWEILPAHWQGLRLQVDLSQRVDARRSPLTLHLEGEIHADTSLP